MFRSDLLAGYQLYQPDIKAFNTPDIMSYHSLILHGSISRKKSTLGKFLAAWFNDRVNNNYLVERCKKVFATDWQWHIREWLCWRGAARRSSPTELKNDGHRYRTEKRRGFFGTWTSFYHSISVIRAAFSVRDPSAQESRHKGANIQPRGVALGRVPALPLSTS